MATGGPTRSAALGLLLLTGALVTGCAGPASGRTSDTTAGHTSDAASAQTSRVAPASPSPRATTPAEVCARIVAYWSREVLDDGSYGDYQSMGLSNGQYDILRNVVDAARTERERQGRAAAEQLIDRQARVRCAGRYRDGGPTGGPWS
ncbi:hypothetical protein [Streptomyces chromofuscus]|uniref:Lipoprotein n=1 Tax=Streptomyces chromofuscus TaxID=42881 RepID=A0A7M2TBK8_STRCW|nr:hypothetical protein [Streptomyces chromofuscus]QOV46086.1 hypothetical protein IPT68_09360 [Streptomyces chromofuscus]GGT12774.1 hypothetical protein GCM10010254_36830 [Streptomyces chromofuscus]